jgi:hypothetical protein
VGELAEVVPMACLDAAMTGRISSLWAKCDPRCLWAAPYAPALSPPRGPPEQGLGMPPRSRIAWGRRPPRDVRSYLDDFGTQREILIGEDPLIRCILPRYLTAVARKDLGCSEIGFTGSAGGPQELPLWQ